MAFGELVGRNSTSGDRVIFYLGLFGSFFFGAAAPAFCIIFSNLIDEVGENVSASAQSLGTD